MFERIDTIISNDVFEWVISEIDAQIAQYAAKKKPPPEELVDKRQQAQIALSLLQAKVEAGQLSQEDYLNQMKAKIEEEKGLAKKYMTEGKKDLALLALRRSKIMEKEVSKTEKF